MRFIPCVGVIVTILFGQCIQAQDQAGTLQIDSDFKSQFALISTYAAGQHGKYLSVDKKSRQLILVDEKTHWMLTESERGTLLTHVGFISLTEKCRPGTGYVLGCNKKLEVSGFPLAKSDAKDDRNFWVVKRMASLGRNDRRTRPWTIENKVKGALSVRNETGEIVGEHLTGANQPYWNVDIPKITIRQMLNGKTDTENNRDMAVQVIIEAIKTAKAGGLL